MTERADPFGDDAPSSKTKIDLSGFKPRKPPASVKPEDIRKVAEQASFPSREPVVAAPAPEAAEPRLYRTGRNIQFSCKVTQVLHDDIYALTDELARRMEKQVPGVRWTVGMTVERMVGALQRELKADEG
ncbi:MAG: stability/partitioning determinant [Vicinamibacterales bacterium]